MDDGRIQLFKTLLTKNFNESNVVSIKKAHKTLESFAARGLARSGICFSALLESESEVLKELILNMLSEVKRITGEKETALICLEILEQACRDKLPVVRNNLLTSLNKILPGDHGLIKYIDIKISELQHFLGTELNIARGEWKTGVTHQKKEEVSVTYNISGNPQISHGSENVTQIMHNNDIRDLIPLLNELLREINTSTSPLPEDEIKDANETVEIVKDEVQRPGASFRVVRKLWATLPEGVKVLDIATRIWSILERIG